MRRTLLKCFWIVSANTICLLGLSTILISKYTFPALTKPDTSAIEGTHHDFKDDLNSSFKRILYWTKWWSAPHYMGIGQRPFLEANCPENRCVFITDKNELNYSDALWIHLRNYGTESDLPVLRFPFQLYIMYNVEPPPNTVEFLEKFRYTFNIFWTFRHDSTLVSPIGAIIPLTEKDRFKAKKKLWRNCTMHKSKLVAWVVTRCNATSGRDWVGSELQKYIHVHKYGACGNRTFCPKHGKNNKGLPCMKDIYKQYKFYLAFENSICMDYISEKLWYTMRANYIIPIVLGGGNYSSLLPKKSYIDIKDFSSIKELADYINILDKNDTMYCSYFQWKDSYKVIGGQHNNAKCKLCQILHDKNCVQNFPVRDVLNWYRPENACETKKQYFRNIKESPWKSDYEAK